MGKKINHIRVRLTESQFRWLASVVFDEQRTKSEIIRDALNKYLVENIGSNRRKEGKRQLY